MVPFVKMNRFIVSRGVAGLPERAREKKKEPVGSLFTCDIMYHSLQNPKTPSKVPGKKQQL
jgi:hypothetical protein